jgi:hypothetical protein
LRRRLLRPVLAGVLAVVLAAAGTAQDAKPDEVKLVGNVQVQAVDPYAILTQVAIDLLGRVFGGGGVSEADLARAVAQIQAQIEQIKVEIINHVDLIASAEVQACVRTHTIEFLSIETMPRTVLQLWAQRATECAEKATAYLGVLTSGQAIDNIGWLVGEIFSIVVTARTKAGLTAGLDLVRQDEIRAFQSVKTKLTPPDTTSFGPAPRCVTWWQYADPSGFYDELYYQCWGYNGSFAGASQKYAAGSGGAPWGAVEPPIDYEGVRSTATQNTSRPLAISALADLLNLRPIG